MKKSIVYIFLLATTNFACTTQVSSNVSSSSTIVLASETEDDIYNFSLNAYPTVFLKEENLEDWDDFEEVYKSMERLSELNLNDIQVDLLALSSRLKNISKKEFPGELEIPQLRSRLKVVEMQAQKSRYFTRHYKKDSLVPSIEKLYVAYNALLSRMLSLKEESSAVSAETETLD